MNNPDFYNLAMTLQQIAILSLLCSLVSIGSSITTAVSAYHGSADTCRNSFILAALTAAAAVTLTLYGPEMTF